MGASDRDRDAIIVPRGVQSRVEGISIRLHQIDLSAAHAAYIVRVAIIIAAASARLRILRHAHQIKRRVAATLSRAQVDRERECFAEERWRRVGRAGVISFGARIGQINTRAIATHFGWIARL